MGWYYKVFANAPMPQRAKSGGTISAMRLEFQKVMLNHGKKQTNFWKLKLEFLKILGFSTSSEDSFFIFFCSGSQARLKASKLPRLQGKGRYSAEPASSFYCSFLMGKISNINPFIVGFVVVLDYWSVSWGMPQFCHSDENYHHFFTILPFLVFMESTFTVFWQDPKGIN